MRILVCGGRTWGYTPESNYKERDIEQFNCGLDYLKRLNPVCVISGGAKGADELGPMLSDLLRRESKVFRADWKKHGKAAGPIRNKQMLDKGKPDLVVAFPGGSGTSNMVKQAREAGVEVLVVE